MSTSSGRFVFVHPIERFEFFDRASMQIDRATLCTRRSAIARLSRLHGWKNVPSEYRGEFVNGDTFLLTEEYGHSHQAVARAECYAHDIMNVLACAMMYFRGRNTQAQFGLKGRVGPARSEYALVSTLKAGTSHSGWRGHGSWLPTQLDGYWWRFLSQRKMNRMFSLRSSKRFTDHWKDTLWRAAVLIGRSQQVTSRSEALLLLVMALDALLLRRFDRSDALERRVYGLLGWANLQVRLTRVSDLYKLRCDIVHEGKMNVVRPLDLHHLDFFVLNVFENIWRLGTWRTKDALIRFAEDRAASQSWSKSSRLRVQSVAYGPSYTKMGA